MKKKRIKIGHGILAYAVIFSAAIVGLVLLIAIASNTGLSSQLKTHVSGGSGDANRLDCPSAQTLVDANINELKFKGVGRSAYYAYVNAKDNATLAVKSICAKDKFTCNGGEATSLDDPSEPPVIVPPPDYQCADGGYPLVTINACTPDINTPATGAFFSLQLIDKTTGEVIGNPVRDFRRGCTIVLRSESEASDPNGRYEATCSFKAKCKCTEPCTRVTPTCEKTKEATNSNDPDINNQCKGERGLLTEGYVTGTGSATNVLKQSAIDEAKKAAVEDAKSKLKQSCTNWDELHSNVGPVPVTPECTLKCGYGCIPPKGYDHPEYDPVINRDDGTPTIDNFSCSRVKEIPPTTEDSEGLWHAKAEATNCAGQCLMEALCIKKEEYMKLPTTSEIPK